MGEASYKSLRNNTYASLSERKTVSIIVSAGRRSNSLSGSPATEASGAELSPTAGIDTRERLHGLAV
eukprot:6587378-Pyramimonas_sp.AAC.1